MIGLRPAHREVMELILANGNCMSAYTIDKVHGLKYETLNAMMKQGLLTREPIEFGSKPYSVTRNGIDRLHEVWNKLGIRQIA